MVERISFYDQISRNKRNSILLFGIVGALLIALIYSIAKAFSGLDSFVILIMAIIITTIYSLVSYYSSDSIALMSVGAIKANQTQYRQYYNSVEGLTYASGIPMPQLYIMNNPQINAFATGRDPKHAVICVTTGALEKLNKQELEGVLAHEMSHIANYDIRFMTLTAILVGMISIVAQIFLRSLWFKNSDSDNNKAQMIFLVIGIVLAILAPIVTSLVQLAISRKREYVADATAVKFTRSPTGLINALTKIKSNSEMKVSGSVSPLFLAKPNKAAELFSTHPPLEKRIEILNKM
ncbi:MAG: M48 family metallopeptidase [archaeon]